MYLVDELRKSNHFVVYCHSRLKIQKKKGYRNKSRIKISIVQDKRKSGLLHKTERWHARFRSFFKSYG